MSSKKNEEKVEEVENNIKINDKKPIELKSIGILSEVKNLNDFTNKGLINNFFASEKIEELRKIINNKEIYLQFSYREKVANQFGGVTYKSEIKTMTRTIKNKGLFFRAIKNLDESDHLVLQDYTLKILKKDNIDDMDIVFTDNTEKISKMNKGNV